MDTFLPDQPVSVTLAVPLDSTDVSYRVIDQSENIIVARTATVALAGETEYLVSVIGTNNALPAEAVRALRVVEAYFTTPAGQVKVSKEYLIEDEQVLVEHVNSYQTYGEAILANFDLVATAGWDESPKTERIAAMISAWRNIGKLRFRYPLGDVDQTRLIVPWHGYEDINDMTPAEWATMPVDFVAALKRAQLFEADFLLQGGENPIDKKRRDGILSETIGESSMFMRTSKPLEQMVCKRAMKELSKYLDRSVKLGRA